MEMDNLGTADIEDIQIYVHEADTQNGVKLSIPADKVENERVS